MNDNISTFPPSSERKHLGQSSEEVFDVSENTSPSPIRPPHQGLRSSMYEGLRSQGGERGSVLDNPKLGGFSPTQRRQAAECYRKQSCIFWTSALRLICAFALELEIESVGVKKENQQDSIGRSAESLRIRIIVS